MVELLAIMSVSVTPPTSEQMLIFLAGLFFRGSQILGFVVLRLWGVERAVFAMARVFVLIMGVRPVFAGREL